MAAEIKSTASTTSNLGIDTSTINGRLVANIVMSVAEWERDIIAERTTEALAEAREAGVQLGRPPAVPDHTVTVCAAFGRPG